MPCSSTELFQLVRIPGMLICSKQHQTLMQRSIGDHSKCCVLKLMQVYNISSPVSLEVLMQNY